MKREKRYLQSFEIEYLKENGEQLTTMQLANAIGCSQTTIHAHCKRLRITPTKSYFQFNPPVIPPCVKN